MAGLRERKKAATRKRIADAASAMFFTRGFEKVTVAEIAEAAEVSKMTVFNYFERKEDLFFDREDELTELIRSTLRQRGRAAPITALRRMLEGLIAAGHPFTGSVPGAAQFWDVVERSPALRARGRELREDFEAGLARALRLAVKARAHDPMGGLAGGLVALVFRTVHDDGLRRLRAGDEIDGVRAAQRALLARGFDMIEAALRGTPYV
jgi:AcrR family transcriptional regulator